MEKGWYIDVKYCCLDIETNEVETEVFTLGDLYEAMNLDVRTLRLSVNTAAPDMSPMHALTLVNKWNRQAQGTHVCYLEESFEWL